MCQRHPRCLARIALDAGACEAEEQNVVPREVGAAYAQAALAGEGLAVGGRRTFAFACDGAAVCGVAVGAVANGEQVAGAAQGDGRTARGGRWRFAGFARRRGGSQPILAVIVFALGGEGAAFGVGEALCGVAANGEGAERGDDELRRDETRADGVRCVHGASVLER